MLKKIGLAAGAFALVGAPIALQASERVIAPVEGEQELGGGSNVLIAAVAGAILIAFIVITASDDDEPVSP